MIRRPSLFSARRSSALDPRRRALEASPDPRKTTSRRWLAVRFQPLKRNFSKNFSRASCRRSRLALHSRHGRSRRLARLRHRASSDRAGLAASALQHDTIALFPVRSINSVHLPWRKHTSPALPADRTGSSPMLARGGAGRGLAIAGKLSGVGAARGAVSKNAS